MNETLLTSTPKLTPMMEQYRSIKKTLPSHTILFFRLGDFYEMFFEDAERAAQILNITLTGREAGEAGRVPMCGIPYHSSNAYIKMLVENNLKVAICEQVGDPKASKGLVERKVTRVISPAAYLEDESKAARAEYLVSVTVEKQNAGLACLELSTGEFWAREFPVEKLFHELALLSPREVVFAKSLEKNQVFSEFLQKNMSAVATVYEDWIFDSVESLKLIKETFQIASDRSLEFYDKALAVGACGGALYYLRDHFHSSIAHIGIPRWRDFSHSMVLDRQTQRSLEILTNLTQEKNGPTLLKVMDQTMTSMGSRVLQDWLMHPLLELKEIYRRQEGISSWIASPDGLTQFRRLLSGVRDMERTLGRLNTGVANARDLVNLKLFLERIPELSKRTKSLESSWIVEERGQLKPFDEIQQLIRVSIIEEPPLGLRDGGYIRDGFSSELDELRGLSKSGKDWLLEFERREIERTGIKSLKVKYSQVFGYTIDISKSNLHLVPSEYIRKQTLANAERFIVPELIQWDEKISGAEDKIKNLEYQIFQQVRATVLESLNDLQKMAKAVGKLDALASLAYVATQKQWIRPVVNESDMLKIFGGRHPVVESMLASGQFVENDTLMDGRDQQLIILTGPNMSGKSTYIRQIAQLVLLAQVGSYIPAQRAEIGLVDRIFTRIGASDDLARGESTFMVEMLETAHILRSATSKSLIILDEVGRGTSTFDGVSIAWSICEYLVTKSAKPRTLFATHYHELTQLEEHFQRIKNFHIAVKEHAGGITFLRKVCRGGSDRSYGLHVAKLAGIPDGIIARAQQILKVLESENQQATRLLEMVVTKKNSSTEDQKLPSLFEAALPEAVNPLEHPVLVELLSLDLHAMTPIELMTKVAAWKSSLEKPEQSSGVNLS